MADIREPAPQPVEPPVHSEPLVSTEPKTDDLMEYMKKLTETDFSRIDQVTAFMKFISEMQRPSGVKRVIYEYDVQSGKE